MGLVRALSEREQRHYTPVVTVMHYTPPTDGHRYNQWRKGLLPEALSHDRHHSYAEESQFAHAANMSMPAVLRCAVPINVAF